MEKQALNMEAKAMVYKVNLIFKRTDFEIKNGIEKYQNKTLFWIAMS